MAWIFVTGPVVLFSCPLGVTLAAAAGADTPAASGTLEADMAGTPLELALETLGAEDEGPPSFL